MNVDTQADLRRCEFQSMEESLCTLPGTDIELKVFWSWEYEPEAPEVGWPEQTTVYIDSIWTGPVDPETGFLREVRANMTKRIKDKNKALLDDLKKQVRAELEQRRKRA